MDLTKAKKIHEGKFSLVYLVERGNEKFIIKQLHPRLSSSVESILRFKKEAELPYFEGITAKVMDVKEQDGTYSIIKEYLPGYTLKELHAKFKRKKYQPLYLNLYIELLEKIHQLHLSGIIHGDIKPSNILFSGSDFRKDKANIRILDLGLALRKNELPVKNREQRLPFSMLYAAPELMLNEPAYLSELTDLFSVGVCMYESYSSEVPYMEGHPAILLQMMLAVPLKKQKRIPAEVFDLIAKVTHKPAFMRPIAHYTTAEVLHFLKESLAKRLSIRSAKDAAIELRKLN